MLKNNKKSDNDSEKGFITMIIMMLIILGAVVFLAFKSVSTN